jgi:hypothetical protein
MMRAALWAALLGSLAAGSLLKIEQLARAMSFGRTLGPLLADLSARGLTVAGIAAPRCFLLGLLLTPWLRELRERGKSRLAIAAVALPTGALATLAIPMGLLAIFLGPAAAVQVLTLQDSDAVGIVAYSLVMGIGAGGGALIGLPRKEPAP